MLLFRGRYSWNTDRPGIPARYQEYRPGTEYRPGIVEYPTTPVYRWNTGPVFYQSTLDSSSFVSLLHHDKLPLSKMRSMLFSSLCEYGSRHTRDVLYRIITDAGHFGSRCNKRGATRGCCDLCWYLKDVKVTESTHHVFHECPYAQIATCGMYRAFIGTVGSDDERRRTQQTPTATLCAQHRRALQTGLLIEEGSTAEAQHSEVWHELIAATMLVLEKRRNRNAYFAMPLAYDAADVYREARTLAQTVATGLRLLAMAETDWIKIHYNNWAPEDGKSPIDKWTARWIESGAATVMPSGHVRLLLPATLGEVAGAETEIPDIRGLPGGDAVYNFWMDARKKDGALLGGQKENGDGVGGGAGTGVGTDSTLAAVVLSTSG